MSRLPSRLTTILAATAAAGLSGAAIATAAGSGSSTTSTTPSAQQQAPAGRGSGETPLTGDVKQKVEAAALAEVPGTVVRTETDSDGVYESHIRKSDGTEVEVKVNRNFVVTAVETEPAGGRGGPGGHGFRADLAAVAKALGVTQAKLQSAIAAARPQMPSGGNASQRDADVAAAIAKSLGADQAAVQQVLDASRQNRGGPHGHVDDSALVSALAAKFNVSQAKAQAAVDAAEQAEHAQHQARETAMYAAIAKALGKTTAQVQKAFEANRPSAPATP